MAKKKENHTETKKTEEKEKLEKKEAEKKEKENQNKILKVTLWIIGVVIVIILAYYLYAQTQINFNYKGIKFTTEKDGDLIFYDTITLANSSDGQPFGFRIRTKPTTLSGIPFDDLENFRLMKINGYTFEGNGTFSCQGFTQIALANLGRTFNEIGMQFIYDPNATCDNESRYDYFTFTYGNETAIKETAPNCYNIVVKGNDTQCEILPATEKLMVEMYARYINITGNKIN
jgi:hypothetical protein